MIDFEQKIYEDRIEADSNLMIIESDMNEREARLLIPDLEVEETVLLDDETPEPPVEEDDCDIEESVNAMKEFDIINNYSS